ncbi:MAG: hypothetical protein CSA72_09430 [Rhodobacterales bacterium]|nr:MAG: hypothetical protein CSA72_09430 [Rhodobacterales bacterium]
MGDQAPAMILMLRTVSMMTLIVLVLGMIMEWRMRPIPHAVSIGALMGAAVTLTQLYPLALGDGVHVDSRAVILGLTGAFFGPLSLGITLACGLITRITQGGLGTESGVAAMCVAALVGLAWARLLPPKAQRSAAGLLALGALVNLSLVPPGFYLPSGWHMAFYTQIGAPVFVINVIGVLVFGALINRLFRLFETTAELRKLAMTDFLTGLPNRAQFFERLARCGLERGPTSLIYIDIDHFKSVNDGFGHAAGDALLRLMAQRLEQVLPRGTLLARLGGEEFAVLLPDTPLAPALELAERLRKSVAEHPFDTAQGVIPVTLSLGVHCAEEPCDGDDLVNHADGALYAAKAGGRNRVVASMGPAKHGAALAARKAPRPGQDPAAQTG